MADKFIEPMIREMDYKDLERIIEIDAKILGHRRPGYWQMKVELAKKRSPISSLVAEVDDQVVGFILGGASGGEYGAPENVGWFDTIGVDPAFQKKGIAKILFTVMVNNLKRVGVDTIYTFVNWRNWNLLGFFNNMGFKKGDMINLELKV